MTNEDNIENSSRKNIFLKIFLFIILMIFLYIVMFNFGVNSLLIIIILAFISLIILGSVFRHRKQKSLYSKLYPDKKQKMIQRPPRKVELIIRAEPEIPVEKNFREVDLNFKYRKSLINKCENCGMIITGSNKNCPICGKAIEQKGILKKCKNCGMILPKSVKKCPVCGMRTT